MERKEATRPQAQGVSFSESLVKDTKIITVCYALQQNLDSFVTIGHCHNSDMHGAGREQLHIDGANSLPDYWAGSSFHR